MKKRAMRIGGGIFLIALVACGAALGFVLWRVHVSVREYAAIAQQAHPHAGDDAAALVDFMNSDTHAYQERNHAAWALGRLREAKALPDLEAAYTGKLCDHGNGLCQYELEKAIKLCGGIPNPPRTTRH
jgi:hypothetical protein